MALIRRRDTGVVEIVELTGGRTEMIGKVFAGIATAGVLAGVLATGVMAAPAATAAGDPTQTQRPAAEGMFGGAGTATGAPPVCPKKTQGRGQTVLPAAAPAASHNFGAAVVAYRSK